MTVVQSRLSRDTKKYQYKLQYIASDGGGEYNDGEWIAHSELRPR